MLGLRRLKRSLAKLSAQNSRHEDRAHNTLLLLQQQNKNNNIMTYKIGGKYRREQALGLHEFKEVYNGGDVCRYLNKGDIIEFTGVKFTFSNAEFEINGDTNRKIWLSQFDDIYLHPYTKECVEGVLTLKDGRELSLFNMRNTAFWSFVKGKKFRVFINNDYPVAINRKSTKVKELKSLDKILDYIFTNLDNENYYAV